MRLPNFLIIGAAKAGTTSLYNDLYQHPNIFLPALKEVGELRYDRVLSDNGMRKYSCFFRKAQSHQICGEASTSYTKIPEFPGVPRRASLLLGNNLKLIYIVRDPIARIISHHRHVYSLGWVQEDINQALFEYPYLIDFSRYYVQLDAWLRWFPPENIRVVQFEAYIRNRQLVNEELNRFLGVTPLELSSNHLHRVYNKGAEMRRLNKFLYKITMTGFYAQKVKPMLSDRVRNFLRHGLSKPAPIPNTVLTKESKDWVEDELRPDRERFARLLGLDHNGWEDSNVIWANPVRSPRQSQ